MSVHSSSIQLATSGNGDIKDITALVAEKTVESGILNGVVTVFCPSATSGLTTLEYESGCVQDLKRLFDEILPPDRNYAHNERWGDGNGHSHARAALLGPSISVPVMDQRLTLGTWQQIIFVDFDNRARQRELVVQIIGE